MSERDIDVGGITIQTVRAGDGARRAVMLVHGFTDSARCWGRVIDALSASFDVVALDARNHGRSSTAAGGATELVDDVAAVRDHLGFERPVLIGHSIGAQTVALLAARQPDRVEALVLEDPPWRAHQRDVVEAAPAGVRDYLSGLQARTESELYELARSQHGNWDAAEYPAWVESKQQVRPEAADTLDVVPWGATVERITCPTLLLHGAVGGDGIVTPELAAEITATNPSIAVREITGAGHNIRRENPEAFLESVQTFLAPGGYPYPRT